jgi:hypothetical protein
MLSRFATLGGVATDPYWANVSYLLVGNGANGTTTNIVDSSSNHLGITISGNTAISTNISPPSITNAGSGTVYFDGSGDYLTTLYNSQLLLNGVDATLECWIYPTRSPGAANSGLLQTIFTQGLGWWSGGALANIYWLVSPSTLEIGQAGGTVYSVSYTLPINQWLYLAAVKTSTNSITVYVNGVSLGTQTGRSDFGSSTSYSNLTGLGYFGDSQTANYFQGYIYDFRITKGVARYSGSTMTVPTAAFPTS